MSGLDGSLTKNSFLLDNQNLGGVMVESQNNPRFRTSRPTKSVRWYLPLISG